MVNGLTQEQALLMLLKSGPQTTRDFIESYYGLGAEYRRIISDLRKDGYEIKAERVRKGCWRYTLVEKPFLVEKSGQLILGLA